MHPRADFVRVDLADRGALEAALAGFRPEAVMHFASRTPVGESMERPFRYLRDNVVNGLNLLRGAVEHGVQRFILSSTANFFGLPDEIPITEAAPIRPGSPYGESKYVLERMLAWMDELRGAALLQRLGFRVFRVYAPLIGPETAAVAATPRSSDPESPWAPARA